jgi:hypothetical protein
MIRAPLTALLAAAGIWTIDHIPASAQTGISQYPFCIQRHGQSLLERLLF